jgi:hypothetical protein
VLGIGIPRTHGSRPLEATSMIVAPGQSFSTLASFLRRLLTAISSDQCPLYPNANAIDAGEGDRPNYARPRRGFWHGRWRESTIRSASRWRPLRSAAVKG